MDKEFLDKGWVENTLNQNKKLYLDMCSEELDLLIREIKLVSKIIYSPHLQWKIDTGQVWFDESLIQDTLDSKYLVDQIREYSNILLDDGEKDHRVLIRSLDTVNLNNENRFERYNLMFVVSLNTHEIITCFFTSTYVDFDEINIERYNSSINITQELKSNKRQIRPMMKPRKQLDGLNLDEWLDIFNT